MHSEPTTGIVLAYIPDPAALARLEALLATQGVAMRALTSEHFDGKLAELLGVDEDAMGPGQDVPAGEGAPEAASHAMPLLVFHGFEDADLNSVIASLKPAGLGSKLMVTSTPTNLRWPLGRLYDSATAEFEYYARLRRSQGNA